MKNLYPLPKTGLLLTLTIILTVVLFVGCAAGHNGTIDIHSGLNVGSRELLSASYTIDGKSPEELSSAVDAEVSDVDPMTPQSPEPTTPEVTNQKLVALTFDDGPVGATEDFVHALDELDVNCTFFMLGSLIESYPNAVSAMVSGGHQIASHSYDHPNLTESSNEKVSNQINTTENLLSNIDGKSGHYIRCPYGASNDYVKSVACGPLIHWSVDTEDWKSRDATAVYNSIMSNVYDGCIILCHDIYDSTRAGVLRAIPDLQAAGYELVTVEELLKRRGVDIQNGGTYYYGLNNGTTYSKSEVTLTFGSFAEGKQPQTP